MNFIVSGPTMSADVHAEIDNHLKGYARVKLNDIEFDTGRDLDDGNVRRLISIFSLQSLTKQLSHAKTWKFVSVHHQIVQIPPYNHYILILKPLFCMIDDRYSKSQVFLLQYGSDWQSTTSADLS